MHDIPRECPYCNSDLELDHRYEGKYIVGYLICPNPKCKKDYEVEYSRDHEDDVDIYEDNQDNA